MKTGMIIVIVVILIFGGIITYSLISKTNSSNTSSNQVATGTEVQIQSFSFNPAILKIKVGDTITWTNKDNTLHTITSDSGSELGSQDLSKEQTYSHKFTSIGTYDYHCTYHTSMKGKIIVE